MNYIQKEKIQILREVLNISNLSYLTIFNTSVSFRNPSKNFSEKTIINANIMLEIASNIAREKERKKLNKKVLISYLPEIKRMSLQKAEVFYPRLHHILYESGIVLVGLPGLKNANINGATKKFKDGSVLLLISDKGKDLDRFWFSFVHELAHILNGDINSIYDLAEYKEREEHADRYARNFYIPEEIFLKFISNTNITKDNILAFSSELGVHPGIVVGRLQNDEIIEYHQLNELKSKVEFCFSA